MTHRHLFSLKFVISLFSSPIINSSIINGGREKTQSRGRRRGKSSSQTTTTTTTSQSWTNNRAARSLSWMDRRWASYGPWKRHGSAHSSFSMEFLRLQLSWPKRSLLQQRSWSLYVPFIFFIFIIIMILSVDQIGGFLGFNFSCSTIQPFVRKNILKIMPLCEFSCKDISYDMRCLLIWIWILFFIMSA